MEYSFSEFLSYALKGLSFFLLLLLACISISLISVGICTLFESIFRGKRHSKQQDACHPEQTSVNWISGYPSEQNNKP